MSEFSDDVLIVMVLKCRSSAADSQLAGTIASMLDVLNRQTVTRSEFGLRVSRVIIGGFDKIEVGCLRCPVRLFK